MTKLRSDLPPLPERIQRLPVHRGYPVPWFVAWLDEAGDEVEPGAGTPDFRILHSGAVDVAHLQRRCWLCGERLGVYVAFTIGPMCAVNHTAPEPPSHTDCSDFAARACPFLARPHARRREAGMPAAGTMPGDPIMRNPGVALVWITKARSYRPFRVDNGVLFDIGEPVEVRWYCEGRSATRTEVEASIDTGLPRLQAVADEEGDGAVEALRRQVEQAKELLPA